MQMTIAKSIPLMVTPLSLRASVSTENPCLKRMMKARTRMHATDSPSKTSVSREEMRMSFQAMIPHSAPLSANHRIGVTVPWIPSEPISWAAKIDRPASPTVAINR